MATLEEENAALKEALRPFAEAYELAARLCASRTLGDFEALAKHHTPGGSYQRAKITLSGCDDAARTTT